MENSNPRILTGVVTSNKADKTITVQIERKQETYLSIFEKLTRSRLEQKEECY